MISKEIGLGINSMPVAGIPENTPTVPPSGWVGTFRDFVQKGIKIYQQIKDLKNKPSLPVSTIEPSYLPVNYVLPLTQSTAEKVIPPANVVVIPQKEKETIPQPKKEDYTPLFLGLGVLLVVILIIKGGK